jgi:predicted acyltransferase (DUF342 family)
MVKRGDEFPGGKVAAGAEDNNGTGLDRFASLAEAAGDIFTGNRGLIHGQTMAEGKMNIKSGKRRLGEVRVASDCKVA